MNFKHRTAIQIRFKDVDKMGHVNNANHLTYLESARIGYFEAVVGSNINWSKKGIILARVEIDYKVPVLFDDRISVHTRCARIGTKSFDLQYSIVKEGQGRETEVASAVTVMVCYDYDRNETMPMPKEWREKMEAFER